MDARRSGKELMGKCCKISVSWGERGCETDCTVWSYSEWQQRMLQNCEGLTLNDLTTKTNNKPLCVMRQVCSLA